ncbi:DUF29 domain-containing protein [Salmonella enterica]|nr:DUF29 domain-containing protein [Salmonella enterica subsp. enterica serovar Dahomey]EAW3064172.1 DUF29 domain-containing protein [Salmonella enterica]EDX5413578.1 DUF29 domain-containing protein [Salmonella enterica subsp. enterica serovar Ealing]EAW9081517.1 DUF29 domain-containing protein [Salmonella enterica]EBA1657842.1 DUF29 domain-containing protein [Salmonella enterica]
MNTRYEIDFYGWTQEQARLLRDGQLSELDTQNLLEELESMGGSERRELESRLEILFMHLLKWQYQPARRGKSWQLTINEQRRRIGRRLNRNPSLKNQLEEIIADAYDEARYSAERETGLYLSTFPDTCPWDFEQAMNSTFYPD